MRWNKILITIKKELRAIVRDKKSFHALLIYPLILPFMVILVSLSFDLISDNQNSVYNFGSNYELNMNEKVIVNSLSLKHIYYGTVDELKEAYAKGDITAYIVKEDNNYKVYANTSSNDGTYTYNYIQTYLMSYNQFLGENYLISQDIDTDLIYQNINFELEELEGESFYIDSMLQMILPYVITVICMGAAVIAVDVTAGEKERGTMETLLTFPLKSSEIVTGKYLATTIIGFLEGLFSYIFGLISLSISVNIFKIYEGVHLNINFFTVFLGLIIIISSSILLSGIMIALSSLSNNFKEAQSSLEPLQILTVIPMFLPMIGVETSKLISALPVIGQSMVLNDLFTNKMNISYIIIMFITSVIYIVLIIVIISRQYKSERILFAK